MTSRSQGTERTESYDSRIEVPADCAPDPGDELAHGWELRKRFNGARARVGKGTRDPLDVAPQASAASRGWQRRGAAPAHLRRFSVTLSQPAGSSAVGARVRRRDPSSEAATPREGAVVDRMHSV